MMGAKRHLIFCVTLCALLEAMATSLHLAQDPEDSTPVALELSDEGSEFYDHNGLRCKKCPAGHFVVEHCNTSNTEGICCLCENNTFAKGLNSFMRCFYCSECRPDQVMLQPCTRTSNTRCACKNGTFCSPNLPCEACHKCSTRCSDGDVIVKACTSESNIVCEKAPRPPDTTSQTPVADSNGRTLLIACAMLVVVALVCTVGVFKYRKKFVCCTRASSTGCTATMWGSKTIQWLWGKCNPRQPEEQDNFRNVQVDQNLKCSVLRKSETTPLQTTNPSEEEDFASVTERRRNLVPANGKDRISALRQSFDGFIRVVPHKEWNRYMRALGLTDNDIEGTVAMNGGNVKECHFQMLRIWLNENGKGASLDTLLKTLNNINLRGIEEQVTADLISQGLYIYEE